MKTIYAILLAVVIMLPITVVAQDQPKKSKEKVTTEQTLSAANDQSAAKSKEAKKQYRKYKKEMKELEKKNPTPNVMRDRNIP